MFGRETPILSSPRISLRLPMRSDYDDWHNLRTRNGEFLKKWEPRRYDDQLSETSFRERVKWSKQSFKARSAVALLIFRNSDGALMGAITLDNVRRGPSMAASLGYWLGEEFTNTGYMSEAIKLLVTYAFTQLDISRIEAATLDENKASRKVLERSGFKYEGVARCYLQIAGRWRHHVLYANLRRDRLGETSSGVY